MPYGHPCQPFPLADAANRAVLSRHSLAGLGTRLAAVEEDDDDCGGGGGGDDDAWMLGLFGG